MHDDTYELTFSEIINRARNHATQINIMLDRADPYIALSVLLQLAEIEEDLAGAIYNDLLAMTQENENCFEESELLLEM